MKILFKCKELNIKKHNIILLGMFIFALLISGCSKNEDILPGQRFDAITNTDEDNKKNYQLPNVTVYKPMQYIHWKKPYFNATNTSANFLITPKDYNTFDYKKRYLVGKSSKPSSPYLWQPVVYNNFLYTLSNTGTIRCYNLIKKDKQRSLVWSSEINKEISPKPIKSIQGGLSINEQGNIVYATTGYGYLIALDSKTGKQLWKYNFNTPLRSAPIIYKNNIIIVGINEKIYNIDSINHQIIWGYGANKSESVVARNISPIIKNNIVIAPFSSGELVALNIDSGKIIWKKQIGFGRTTLTIKNNLNSIVASPLIKNNTMFVANSFDVFMALNINTGNIIWQKKLGVIKTPSLLNDWIFILDENNKLLVLQASTGKIKWTRNLINFTKEDDVINYSSPFFINSQLSIVSNQGFLYQFDKNTGEQINSYNLYDKELETGLPIIINNYMYVYTNYGYINKYIVKHINITKPKNQ